MIYALLAPSGAGKGTLAKYFYDFIPRAVSHTTRDKREGEVHGKDFYFIEEDDVKEYNWEDIVISDCGHRGVTYFTKLDEFKQATNVYVEVSVKALHQLKEYFGKDNVVSIYIYAHPNECYERLKKRNGEEYAKSRMYYNYKENSFNNHSEADYVINNTDDSNLTINGEILQTIVEHTKD